MWSLVPSFFHLASCFQGSSMLQIMPFLLPNNIQMHGGSFKKILWNLLSKGKRKLKTPVYTPLSPCCFGTRICRPWTPAFSRANPFNLGLLSSGSGEPSAAYANHLSICNWGRYVWYVWSHPTACVLCHKRTTLAPSWPSERLRRGCHTGDLCFLATSTRGRH